MSLLLLLRPDRRYHRHILPIVQESVATFRVVVVAGPRQAGKTTLVRQLGGTYASLDDTSILAAVRADPAGFLDRPAPLIIDEVQRGRDPLLLEIKSVVDRTNAPGQFVLTGSSRFLTIPTISESLAGRADIVDLLPFSQGEIEQRRERFIDQLFEGPEELVHLDSDTMPREEYFRRICFGGFPEALKLQDRSRRRWFSNYIRTLTQRDAREIARIRNLGELSRIIRFMAARTGREINVSALSNDLGIPRTTVTDYMEVLESLFLFTRVPSWSRSVTSKAIRHPKLMMMDTGLAAALLGASPTALIRPGSQLAGPLLESFVAMEIMKQVGWSETQASLSHFRDRNGPEIDLILETNDGRLAAIETKAGASVSAADVRWMTYLRDRVSSDFVAGVVLYTGAARLSIGDRLYALPVSDVWRT